MEGLPLAGDTDAGFAWPEGGPELEEPTTTEGGWEPEATTLFGLVVPGFLDALAADAYDGAAVLGAWVESCGFAVEVICDYSYLPDSPGIRWFQCRESISSMNLIDGGARRKMKSA